MNEVTLQIKEIEKLENGAKYQTIVKLPLNTGWIDYLDLIVEKGNETLTFPLKHKTNKNNTNFLSRYKSYISLLF